MSELLDNPATETVEFHRTEAESRTAQPRVKHFVAATTRWFVRIAFTTAVIALVTAIAVAGWKLRRASCDLFDALHFETDIQRGSMWGLLATGPEGFLNQYEKMALEDSTSKVWLDYAPLRLLIMSGWGKLIRTHYPDVVASTSPAEVYNVVVPPATRGSNEPRHLETSYQFLKPVLIFNTAMDALASACAFALTWLWVWRSRASNLTNTLATPSRTVGLWQAAVAAILLWLNPNILLSGYGWPTWDAWIVPLYLLAVLLASLNFWFCAGAAIGIGAMLKGQQFAIVPVFALWSIIAHGFGATLRWAAGMLFAIGLTVSPWMLSYLPADQLAISRATQSTQPFANWSATLFAIQRTIDWAAIVWIIGMISAFTLMCAISCDETPPWVARLYRHEQIERRWRLLAGGALIVIAAWWPWMLPRNQPTRWLALPGSIAAAALLCVTIRRGKRWAIAGLVGVSLLVCMTCFHGSRAWWDCAFRFGTLQFPFLIFGPASNLPGLLELRFHWPAPINEIAFTLPSLPVHWRGWMATQQVWPAAPWAISSKLLLNGFYTICLLLSGVGLGLQARRNDRRVLIAIITPWILFFVLPVALHERYLLFAAAASTICIGHSVGAALLGCVLTLASTTMTLHQMFGSPERTERWGKVLAERFPNWCNVDTAFKLFRNIEATHPDIGWGLLVIAGLFLYLSLTRSESSKLKRAMTP